jgi:hypothetical protein
MILTLTDIEFKLCYDLANGRHYVKDMNNPKRDKSSYGNTQAEADLIGMIGEFCVAKYLKIPFSTEISINGDDGTDLMLGDWSIQVKATKYPTGRMVFNKLSEMTSLIYVLCVVDQKQCDIKGYISHRNLLKVMYQKDLGHGLRYCCDQEHLRGIERLTFYYRESKN